MAASIKVSWAGLKVGDKSSAIEYIIRDCVNEDAAITLLLWTAPVLYQGAPRADCQITEKINGTTFKGVATYNAVTGTPPVRPPTVDTGVGTTKIINFQTSGGTRHIDSAIIQNEYGATSSGAIGTLINVSKSGVGGVDIVNPIFSW